MIEKHTLSIEPYDSNCLVIVGTPEEARKYRDKHEVFFDLKYDFEVGGATIVKENYWPLIFLNKRLTKRQRVATFAHECVHLINREFDRVGIEFDPNNDEAYAYLMSYLIKQAQEKRIL